MLALDLGYHGIKICHLSGLRGYKPSAQYQGGPIVQDINGSHYALGAKWRLRDTRS